MNGESGLNLRYTSQNQPLPNGTPEHTVPPDPNPVNPARKVFTLNHTDPIFSSSQASHRNSMTEEEQLADTFLNKEATNMQMERGFDDCRTDLGSSQATVDYPNSQEYLSSQN
jgi:hypothetical protein